MKRLITAVAVFSLMAGSGSALATDGRPMIETSPAKFKLDSKACSKLPEGTTIRGSGTMRSVTTTTTDKQGITSVVNSSNAHGKATDQKGNKYVFEYSNTFRVSNTTQAPALFTGLMYDLFSLAGRGPAVLTNGFVAVFTTDLGEFARLEPIHSFGDPIGFRDGRAHCDPL